MAYYAIFIADKSSNFSIKSFYTDKTEALTALKLHKDARMKAFSSSEQAVSFYLHGPSNEVVPGVLPIPVKSPQVKTTKCQFVAPINQKLVAFRKLIEKNNVDEVRTIIHQNPRYLISSGDTPTILKTGPRYNALHIAAIEGSSETCVVILEAIESVSYIELLHGQQTPSAAEVSAILLDLYLNTPDKCRSETPLHFASKHGWVDVVKTLIAYPQCQVKANSDGMFPRDIICSRAKAANDTAEIRETISALFQEKYFVPLIRSQNNMAPAIVGEPFSQSTIPKINESSDKLINNREIKAYAGPMDREMAERFCKRWKTPPRLKIQCGKSQSDGKLLMAFDRISSSTPIKIKPRRLFMNRSFDAMGESDDCNLQEQLNINNNSDTANESFAEVETFSPDANGNHLRRVSNERNHLFHVYRSLANNSFDSNGTNFSDMDESNYSYVCEETQTMYEKADIVKSPCYKERSIRITDPDKGLEIVGRMLACKENVGWKEYWSFLGQFCNLADEAGLAMFEKVLAEQKHQTEIQKTSDDATALAQPNLHNEPSPCSDKQSYEEQMDVICKSTKQLTLGEISRELTRNSCKDVNTNSVIGDSPPKTMLSNKSLYRCIVNSLQVFALRFAKNLMNVVNGEHENQLPPNHKLDRTDVVLDDVFRKLEKLLGNYRNDTVFQDIDFSKAHSLFAYMIMANIHNIDNKENQLKNRMIIGIRKRLEAQGQADSQLSETWLCVATYLVYYSNNITQIKQVDFDNQTELDCREIWDNHSDIFSCNCRTDVVTYTNRGTLERMSQRREKRANRLTSAVGPQRHPDSNEAPVVDFETYRSHSSVKYNCNSCVDDDELYHSCSDSEDEEKDAEDELYFTPPSSPKPSANNDEEMPFISAALSDESVATDSLEGPDEYHSKQDNLFIAGTMPSKEDFDVWNVLKTVDIDQQIYPHVYAWKKAMAGHID